MFLHKFLTRMILLTLLLLIPTIVFGQVYPQDLGYSKRIELLTDAGIMWETHSMFHPVNCTLSDAKTIDNSAFNWVKRYIEDHASLSVQCRDNPDNDLGILFVPGFEGKTQAGVAREYDKFAWHPFIWAEAHFKRNWYTRLYVRGTNVAESLPHYSGVTRDIARGGMSSGEIDQSVFGYRNDWALVEFGRSREIWGPMAEDNLLPSGTSPAYERLLIQFNYKRMSYRYFYGFLEAIQDIDEGGQVQRYIVGRMLEYRNRRNLLFGVGEVSILAGLNRPVDLAFLNPFAMHLETEQNKRANLTEKNGSNATWLIYVDWLVMSKLRFSGSLAIDEFKLEPQERDKGEPDFLAYSGRIAWTVSKSPVGTTIFAYGVHFDTFTLQHNYKYGNFVTRGQLLGHSIGNDADRVAIGFRTIFSLPIWTEVELGRSRWGGNSLKVNPYETYDLGKAPFLSDPIRTNRYIAITIDSQPFRYLHFGLSGHLDLSHLGEDSEQEQWTFTVRYQRSFQWLNF